MKKIELFAFAALAAFGISSCTKTETEIPASKGNFAITAEITKTVNDSLATNWAENDAINVFHAYEDSTTYVNDRNFTISGDGLATNTFLGTLKEELEAGSAYDWYAFYPYTSYITTPDNTSAGYVTLGCSSSASETQTGNNSLAHLAGKNFPLYAQAKGVDSDAKVALSFKPATSVVKLHVTNTTSSDLYVTSASIEAQEAIVGSFYINFAGASPVYTASNPTYVTNTVKLNVKTGAAIPTGESADFYIAFKPFTNADGDSLTFTVNGYSKATDKAITFAPGKIKTINFNYDYEKPVVDYSGTYVVLAKNSTDYYAMSGVPGSNTYMPKVDFAYAGADTVEVSSSDIVWTLTKTGDHYDFQNLTNGKYLYYNNSGNSASVADAAGDNTKMRIEANGDYVNVFHVSSTRGLRYNTGSPRFAFYSTATGTGDLLLVPAKISLDPVIQPITAPAKVAAEGANGVEVSYTVLNPVGGKSISASSAETWVKNFSYATEGKITFDVEANTGSERSSVITVSYEGAADVQFTVTQTEAGSGTETTYTWTLKSGDLTTSGGTKKSGDITWTYPALSYVGWDGSKGVQIGSSKNCQSECNIYTEGFGTHTIKSIKVNASMGSSGTAKLTINVGGTATSINNEALKTSPADYSATGINKSGKVEIILTTTAKAYYLKSIEVVYE